MNIKKLVAVFFSIICLSSIAVAEVKVLTMNIGALSPFGDTSLRVKSFCSKLKLLKDIDIVFVQEVWLSSYQDMLKDCGFPNHLVMDVKPGIEMRREKKKIKSLKVRTIAQALSVLPEDIGFDKGLMILSKHPLKKSTKVTYKENGYEEYAIDDGEFAVAKGAIGATLTHPKHGDIFIATTHMVADYPDHQYKEQRADQLIQLVNWLGDSAGENPTIVAGDFNASCLKDGNEIDSFLPMGSRSLDFLEGQSTYNGKENIIVQEADGGDFDDGVIDHVIGINGATVNYAKIGLKRKLLLKDDDQDIITNYSDHFGVFSIINIDDQ